MRNKLMVWIFLHCALSKITFKTTTINKTLGGRRASVEHALRKQILIFRFRLNTRTIQIEIYSKSVFQFFFFFLRFCYSIHLASSSVACFPYPICPLCMHGRDSNIIVKLNQTMIYTA